MKNLFINGSPHEKGHIYFLARSILNNQEAEILMLSDYRINVYGQALSGDRFNDVFSKMKEAEVIMIGSPVYWHNICGSVRTLLDRFYGPVRKGALKGKKLIFVFQGGDPEPWMLEAGDYTMRRFANLYGLDYLGMVTNGEEAKAIAQKI